MKPPCRIREDNDMPFLLLFLLLGIIYLATCEICEVVIQHDIGTNAVDKMPEESSVEKNLPSSRETFH